MLRRIAATSSGAACGPTIRRAGSAGITWVIVKVTREIPSSTKTSQMRRLTRTVRTRASRRRSVPARLFLTHQRQREEGLGEQEAVLVAGNILAQGDEVGVLDAPDARRVGGHGVDDGLVGGIALLIVHNGLGLVQHGRDLVVPVVAAVVERGVTDIVGERERLEGVGVVGSEAAGLHLRGGLGAVDDLEV